MVNVSSYERIDTKAYARILALVAMADGVLKEEEVSLYEERLGHLLVPPNIRTHYRKFLLHHFDNLDIVQGVDQRTLLYALRDALWMARIDGELHDHERERVLLIGKLAGVSENKMRALDAWVKEGLEWMERGDALTFIPLPK